MTRSKLMINEMPDRQIVATAIVLADGGENVRILACDRNIIAAGVIPIVW